MKCNRCKYQLAVGKQQHCNFWNVFQSQKGCRATGTVTGRFPSICESVMERLFFKWCALCTCPTTVFPRIDAAAFINFVGQFGAATIRGRRSGNMTCAAYTGSAHNTQPKFCQKAGNGSYKSQSEINKNKLKMGKIGQVHDVFGGSKVSSFSISFRFPTKRYTHGTSNPFPHFLLPVILQVDRPPCLKKCQIFLEISRGT